MPGTKGNKNRPKTNITKDYASQIAEKQTALKKAEKEVASLEAKKAKADARAAEEVAGKRDECGRDPRKTEINNNLRQKNAVWTK